jgi:hypothetical protein
MLCPAPPLPHRISLCRSRPLDLTPETNDLGPGGPLELTAVHQIAEVLGSLGTGFLKQMVCEAPERDPLIDGGRNEE